MQLHGNDIALTYAELEAFGIPTKTIWNGTSRKGKSWQKLTLSGQVHVLYSSIPTRTRRKLPSPDALRATLAQERAAQTREEAAASETQLAAHLRAVHQHGRKALLHHYLQRGYAPEQCADLAAAAAVYAEILTVYRLPRRAELPFGFSKKAEYYQAVIDLLPQLNNPYANWSNARYMQRKLKQADPKARPEKAALAVIDLPRKGNDNRAVITDWHKYIIETYLADTAKYYLREVHQLVATACEMQDKDVPKYSTLKAYACRPEVQGRVERDRMGLEYTTNTRLPYVIRRGPAYPNDVWELDGTRMNLAYRREDGKVGFMDWLPVIDGHSLAILGYAVGANENQWLVRSALKMAVAFSGVLPVELVMDNSSATKAQETTDLLHRMTGLLPKDYKAIDKQNDTLARNSKVGNARDKRIERFFETFQNYEGRRYPNWLGEGVLSKRKNARSTPEYLAAQRKHLPTLTGLIGQIAEAVEHYNHYQPHGKAAPMQAYRAIASPNATPVLPEVQAMLFWERRLVTVRNDLVRLTVQKAPLAYRLKTYAQHRDLNGKQVYAFYDTADLETIHLYAADGTREGGLEPGKYLGELEQALAVSGNRATMEPEDLAEMRRVARHKKQLEAEREADIQRIQQRAQAEEEIPEEVLNLHLRDTAKHDRNAVESSSLTRLFLQEHDLTHAEAEEQQPEPVRVETPYNRTASGGNGRRRKQLFGDDDETKPVRRVAVKSDI